MSGSILGENVVALLLPRIRLIQIAVPRLHQDILQCEEPFQVWDSSTLFDITDGFRASAYGKRYVFLLYVVRFSYFFKIRYNSHIHHILS